MKIIKPFLYLLSAILMVGLVGCLASCKSIIPSYTVDGSGRDWKAQPVQNLPADRVTPNVKLPLPNQLGGGTVNVPLKVEKAK